MKRIIIVLLVISILNYSLAAATHQSLPLGHRAYEILDLAEIRGIINPLPSVKPYARSLVVSQMEEIAESSLLSSSEKGIIAALIEELTATYVPSENLGDVVKEGAYMNYWDPYDIGARVGVTGEFVYTQGVSNTDSFQTHIGIKPYFEADISDFLSIYMDFGLLLDHLDPRLFLPNDFVIPTEARYDTIFDTTGGESFYYGAYYSPEISLSFLDGNLQLRAGSIQRDWGVGMNNFMISGSARSFEGAEVSITFAPWLNFQFIAGSLGKFWDKELNDISYFEEYLGDYQFSESMLGTQYDNNISAQRVELSLPWNLTAGIYESVLYRKRFELAYLNPFSMLMFQQVNVGDFDNMLAGIDLQWTVPGIMRLYGAFATTEMDKINPSELFKEPRNIMAFQGGVDLDLPFGSFTKATVQYTNISPFFYTHYPVYLDYNDDRDIDDIYELSYVNEGANLGYPLRPGSDEFLAHISFQIDESWSAEVTGKYQRRSGQYGFNMDTYMIYSASQDEEYDEKAFADNLFEQAVAVELALSKRMKDVPFEIQASYIYHGNRKKELSEELWWVYPVYDGITTEPNSDDPLAIGDSSYVSDTAVAGEAIDREEGSDLPTGTWESFPIQYSPVGNWSSFTHSHAVQVGFYVWK